MQRRMQHACYRNRENHFVLTSEPASGVRSLFSENGMLRYFNWSSFQLYYQADEKMTANLISEAASEHQYKFKTLQNSPSLEEDMQILLKAESNIMIFVGGAGCFGPLVDRMTADNPGLVIICCCGAYTMASTNYPLGAMNLVIGHSYIGHNYTDHNYIGHHDIGHNYIGHNYRP